MAQHSRGANPPESCERSPSKKQEGAGNAGCPMHPQPRVRFVVGVCTRVFTAEAPETSGIPHAMVLRLIRDLPGDRALLPPSPLRSLLLKNLAPASGRQDHTISPSTSG